MSNIIDTTLVLVVLISALFLLPAPQRDVAAATLPVFIPFGGKILTTQFCDSGILATIGPPRGGLYFFKWGISILYLHYQIFRPGPWTLGRAYPKIEICYIPCQTGRCPIGAGLLIDKVGTSLF